MVAALLIVGCSAPDNLQVQVTPMGNEPAVVLKQYMYGLPQTVLRVEITFEEVRSIPGPYWEYSEKYLGIKEIIKQKSSSWRIQHVTIEAHDELDPVQFYTLNLLEGEFNEDNLIPYFEKGILMTGSERVSEVLTKEGVWEMSGNGVPRYMDLGIYSNFEERTETMYKTLVTDTSFVKVPVQRTVVEQKSASTKAKEAADFLLELRTRRFEMLTGEYEVYPDGEAMSAAITKLDQLEASYLSLFTGKTIVKREKRAYFIVPDAGSSPSSYNLDMFSEQLGFVPVELLEGHSLAVHIVPLRITATPEKHFSNNMEVDLNNRLLYRIPDVVELKVMWGERVLLEQRISIFQSGAVVSAPLQ